MSGRAWWCPFISIAGGYPFTTHLFSIDWFSRFHLTAHTLFTLLEHVRANCPKWLWTKPSRAKAAAKYRCMNNDSSFKNGWVLDTVKGGTIYDRIYLVHCTVCWSPHTACWISLKLDNLVQDYHHPLYMAKWLWLYSSRQPPIPTWSLI